MTILQEIAILLDGDVRYYAIVFLTLGLTLAVTFAPVVRGGRFESIAHRFERPGWFLFAITLALLAMRWPLFCIPFAFNPDESQVIAQAITLLEDPVIFRAAQSGSTGPFWTYFIMLPGLLGLDVDYGTTRFIGVLLMAVTMAFLYASVRLVSGEIPARLATWPALLCFGLPRTRDFLHYSSEYPALPLFGAALFLMLFYHRFPERRPLLVLALLGTALGGFPFAKLQTSVIALPIAAFAGLYVLFAGPADKREKSKHLAALIGGGLFFTALFFLMFLVTGVFTYFWNVYIVNNFHYAERGTPFFQIIWDYMTTPVGFEPVPMAYKALVVSGSTFCLVRLGLWCRKSGRRDHPWLPVGFAALVFAVSVYAVAAPGRHFPHYLHLIVLPLCLLCGLLMHDRAPAGEIGEAAPAPAPPRLTLGSLTGIALLLVPFLSFLMLPVFFGAEAFRYPGITQIRNMAETPPKYPGPIINEYKKPGDHLSVWGWHADYYVDTQLPMGTRSAVTEFHIRDVPLRDYYRRHYLEEFRKRNPAFFIDAVGPLSHEFTDPALHGHEIFPEFAEHIAANYVIAGSNTKDQQLPVRFYIRRDRAAEIESARARQP